jgi:hypothetical protein
MSSLSQLSGKTSFLLALQVPILIWLVSALYLRGELHKSNPNDARAEARAKAFFVQNNSMGGERPSEAKMWSSIHQQMLIPSLAFSVIGIVLALKKTFPTWRTVKTPVLLSEGPLYNRVCIHGLLLGIITLLGSGGYWLYSQAAIAQSRTYDKDYKAASTITIERRDAYGPYTLSQNYSREPNHSAKAINDWERNEPMTYLLLKIGIGLTLVSAIGFFVTRRKAPSL